MNRPGVLNRVASLMRARNFNIDSLAVSRTDREQRQPDDDHDPRRRRRGGAGRPSSSTAWSTCSRSRTSAATSSWSTSSRFVKVRATDANRAEVIKIVELYKGRVVDIAPESVIVEATGTEGEIDALVALLRGYGIKELVRTGAVVMLRGAGSIEEALKL